MNHLSEIGNSSITF